VAADPDDPCGEARPVSFGSVDDGPWHLTSGLPLDQGAVVEQALVAARQDLFLAGHGVDGVDDGTGRDVTWADALVVIAEHYLASGQARRPGADRYRINVHLEANPADPSGPPVAGLHLGARLPTSLRRYLTCDADLHPVWQTKGRPLAVGRSQRIVSDALRRLIEDRDGGCTMPGCERTRWLVIHHIVHWEDGGETEPANLTALCWMHHRQHHLGRLGITSDPHAPGGLIFKTPDGRTLHPSGRPKPVTKPPPAAAADLGVDPDPYRHPTGEPLHTKWVDFDRNPPPDAPLDAPPEEGTAA
jgi:hypothetical protein